MSALWTPQAPCSSRGASSGLEPSGGVLTSEFQLQGTVQCVDGRSFILFSTLNFLLCVQLTVGRAGGTVQVKTVQVKAAVRMHAPTITGQTVCDSDLFCRVAAVSGAAGAARKHLLGLAERTGNAPPPLSAASPAF